MKIARTIDPADAGQAHQATEDKLHWSEWLLISFAFLILGSMILHSIVYSGM